MLLKLRESCVLCDQEFGTDPPVLTLPDTPCANEFAATPRHQEEFPLNLYLCSDCGHLQLEAVVDPGYLFSNYVYTSGTSPVFVQHFSDYAENLINRYALTADSVVVDIGSNDGTLLKEFAKHGMHVHGVEPAKDIAVRATLAGIPTINAFFDPEIVKIFASMGHADIITANNVFAHIDDLESVTLAIREMLAPDGVFVFEVSYLLDVVQHLLFDTIYHEHLSYHAIRPLQRFFGRLGMTLFDAERVTTHGGSIRCHVSKRSRPVSERVGELIALETEAELFSPQTYQTFRQAIDVRRLMLIERLAQVRAEGGRLCGYGAPAKLTTLMYTLDLAGMDFSFVVDDSPCKQGLFTPGKHIRVVSKKTLREISGKGFYCVVFAWNFFNEIVKANADWDGKWINPVEGN